MNKLRLMKSVKAAALVVALALGAGVGVHAMPGGPGHPHRFDGPEFAARPMDRMLESVDASEAQHKRIREIMDAAFKDLKPQHEAMRQLHLDSRKLLTAATIDAAAVEAKRVQMQAQHEAISKRMSLALVEAAKVLSPEQRAKLAERMAKREARRAEHMKDRGPAARGGQ
jgi:Spy/CpxP family protein refolding chaperone